MNFIKNEAVFCISLLIAIISCIFIPPDINYLSYIDFRVIGILFCLMSVVAGFNQQGVFEKAAVFLIKKAKSTKMLSITLVGLCFFMAMFITNDVALITFVPFTIMTLKLCNKEKNIIYIVVLQTIGANLGSSLTPIGNPQNLFLYYTYNIKVIDFFSLTIPVALISFILLLIFSAIIKNEPISTENLNITKNQISSPKYIFIYSLLGILSLLSVFNIIKGLYIICTVIIILFLIFFDRKIFKTLDLFLIPTFICFFIFVGNIGRITIIKEIIQNSIIGNEFLISLILSQIISNVPCAVMISKFTQNYTALVLGTNIGGLGTLVASLASLISFRLYSKYENCNKSKYMLIFTTLNAIFLIILIAYSTILI